MAAAAHGFTDRVRKLLARGVDSEGRGSKHPIYQGRSPVQEAALAGHTDIVSLSVDAGASWDHDDVDMLLAAAMVGDRDTVARLLAADPRLRTRRPHRPGCSRPRPRGRACRGGVLFANCLAHVLHCRGRRDRGGLPSGGAAAAVTVLFAAARGLVGGLAAGGLRDRGQQLVSSSAMRTAPPRRRGSRSNRPTTPDAQSRQFRPLATPSGGARRSAARGRTTAPARTRTPSPRAF